MDSFFKYGPSSVLSQGAFLTEKNMQLAIKDFIMGEMHRSI